MPCPHFNMTIISRGDNKSAVEKAAYQSREKLYSERDHRTKNYEWKEDLVYKEILLPPNAPEEFSNREILWNSVEAAEPNWNSQLCRRFFITLPRELSMETNVALVREYCEKEFMEKGMIVDLCVHDPDPPNHNPHAHVLTTMRPLDEHGHWGPKSRKEYKLDESGNRIRDGNGKCKTYKVFTTDWDKRSNGEMWRNHWEKLQNQYLEQAGRPERVCLKSYKRQGIDQIPTVHMGPNVAAMERQGIQTDIGNLNRDIQEANRQLSALKRLIGKLTSWLFDVKEAVREVELQPKEVSLANLLILKFKERKDDREENWDSDGGKWKAKVKDLQSFAQIINYMSENKIRNVEDLAVRFAAIQDRTEPYQSEIRQIGKRMKTIDMIRQKYERRRELKPVHDQYLQIHWKGRQQKFAEEHQAELDEWKSCDRYLRKFLPEMKYDSKSLQNEYDSLQMKLDQLSEELKPFRKDLDMLKDIRYLVREYLPELKPEGKELTPERKAEKRESIKARLAKAEKEADALNADLSSRYKTKNRIVERSIGD